MQFMRKNWSPQAADEWTAEDWVAMVLSVISYLGIGIGTPLAFFGITGWLLLAVGVIAMFLMIAVIDPKLKAVSAEFEKKQQEYLDRLQRLQRWEE